MLLPPHKKSNDESGSDEEGSGDDHNNNGTPDHLPHPSSTLYRLRWESHMGDIILAAVASQLRVFLLGYRFLNPLGFAL